MKVAVIVESLHSNRTLRQGESSRDQTGMGTGDEVGKGREAWARKERNAVGTKASVGVDGRVQGLMMVVTPPC